MAVLVVLCNSIIGLVITAVYKYADVVLKNIASSLTTALLMIVGAFLFNVEINLTIVMGLVVVMASTWIYLFYGNMVPQSTYQPVPEGSSSGSNDVSLANSKTFTKNQSSFNSKKLFLPFILALLFIGCAFMSINLLFFGTIADDSKSESAKHALADSQYLNLPVQSDSVALCFSGSGRGLADKEVYESIQSKFIENFSPAAFGKSVGKFFVLNLDGPSSYTIAEVTDALIFLAPTKLQLIHDFHEFPPSNCTVAPRTFPLMPPVPGPGTTFWSQFQKVKMCYDMMVEQELSQGWRYDWFSRMRPDMLWLSPGPVNFTTASRSSVTLFKYPPGYGSLSDHWALMPHTIAPIYTSAVSTYFNCTTREELLSLCGLHPFSEDAYSECYLAKWFRDQGLDTDKYLFDFRLVRGNKVHFKSSLQA